MSRFRMVVGLFSVATVCAVGRPADAADVAADVCTVRASAYDAAMETGSVANLVPMFLPDAILNGPYGISEGHKAIAAAYSGFVKPGVKHGHAVKGGRALGDAAMCWGEWTFTYATADGGKGLAGRYTAIYAKGPQGWRIESLTWNLLPPAPAKTN